MSSLGASILPVLDAIRGIGGSLGLRPTALTIISRQWDGGRRNVGTPIDTSLSVVTSTGAPYITRHVTEHEIAQSGGRYEVGDVRVGPITPQYTSSITGQTGGYTEAQLDPPVSMQGNETIYRLTGQQNGASGIDGDYQLVDIKRDRQMDFTLTIRRRLTTP